MHILFMDPDVANVADRVNIVCWNLVNVEVCAHITRERNLFCCEFTCGHYLVWWVRVKG